MITSTIHSNSRQRGFTLVELIIGATLGSFVLVGVLTSFLMLARSGAGAVSYSVMESQSRRALEEFSQDVRMASDVAWNSTTSLTLLVPNNYIDLAVPANNNRVTYAYDSTAKTFYRMPGLSTATNPHTTLISNISTFVFSRYDRVDNLIDPSVTIDTSTKRIQLSMLARTSRTTLVDATNNVLSASFILRNKPGN